jgi:4-hydroxyphenylpyruvate dioxygenase
MSEPAGSATAHLPRSIATVSLSGTRPAKLDAAATVGFDAVEIFENDLLTFDDSPADVRRIVASLRFSQ